MYPQVDNTQASSMVVLRQPSQSIREADISLAILHSVPLFVELLSLVA